MFGFDLPCFYDSSVLTNCQAFFRFCRTFLFTFVRFCCILYVWRCIKNGK
nr:MAG TPA: hypothetical protein [Caudoviricetes sp.]